MSRRLLTTVTMVVLLGLLAVGALVGWRALSAPAGEESEEPEAASGCSDGVQSGEKLSSNEVTVSVFNAGDRSGLAGQTLEGLVSRGFLEGEVGNAPGSLARVRVVRILAPNREDPAARLVAAQFGPNTFVQESEEDLGPGVDVVVGDEYVGMVKAPRTITAQASGSGC
jgi:hypothetical protein